MDPKHLEGPTPPDNEVLIKLKPIDEDQVIITQAEDSKIVPTVNQTKSGSNSDTNKSERRKSVRKSKKRQVVVHRLENTSPNNSPG